MSHPFEFVEQTLWLKVGFAVVLVAALALTAQYMKVLGEKLVASDNAVASNRSGVGGMLLYEFAGSEARANEILTTWEKNEATKTAKQSLYVDFLFLVIYSTTFAYFCYLVASTFSAHSIWFIIGMLLVYGQWLAAIFDSLENIALLAMLWHQEAITALPQLAFWFAAFKFFLVFVGVGYIVVGGLILGVSKLSG